MKKYFNACVVWGVGFVSLLFLALSLMSFAGVINSIESAARGTAGELPALSIIESIVGLVTLAGVCFLSCRLAFKTNKEGNPDNVLRALSLIILVYLSGRLIVEVLDLAQMIAGGSRYLADDIVVMLLVLAGAVCAILSFVLSGQEIPASKKAAPYIAAMLAFFLVIAFNFGASFQTFAFMITCIVFTGLGVIDYKNHSQDKTDPEENKEESINE